MERLQKELRQYAVELSEHLAFEHSVEDYCDFLNNLLAATVRHHGEATIAQMSEETIMKVIKSQVRELIQLKRIHKLLKKRDRI